MYASIAPLAYLAERVAGLHAEVVTLTPAGADPHGAELSPGTVARLAEADLLVYASGLQPALDQALEAAAPDGVVDTLEAATAPAAGELDGPDPARDPHFWLDPVRFGLAAHQVADGLAAIDPQHASEFAANAEALVADLEDLDAEYRTALAGCAGATLVTSHEAFGYLAARYGLVQQGITGIDPEVEPSPARIREVAEIVQETDVRTIFFETSADPAVAERLAEDLGIATAVLDPMERSPSDLDYLAVMRTNLDSLTAGLTCQR